MDRNLTEATLLESIGKSLYFVHSRSHASVSLGRIDHPVWYILRSRLCHQTPDRFSVLMFQSPAGLRTLSSVRWEPDARPCRSLSRTPTAGR